MLLQITMQYFLSKRKYLTYFRRNINKLLYKIIGSCFKENGKNKCTTNLIHKQNSYKLHKELFH